MHRRGSEFYWFWSHLFLAKLYVIHDFNRIDKLNANYLKKINQIYVLSCPKNY